MPAEIRGKNRNVGGAKTKPRATFSPGPLTCPVTVVIIGNYNNESQDYLRRSPVRNLLASLPYQNRESGEPGGSRTHTFKLGRLTCCQLHHGPFTDRTE